MADKLIGVKPQLDALAKINSFYNDIKCASDLFTLADTMFETWLAPPQGAPHAQLLSKANRDLIRRVDNCREAVIVAYGPNNAGKSTLLNTILGCRIMPSGPGHVTGRVCIIAYAPAAEARITTQTLDQLGTTQLLSSEALNMADMKSVTALMDKHLNRKHMTTNIGDWVRTIVQIYIPSPLLEHGLKFVDLPGTSKTDDKPIQDNLRDFLRITRPPGVMLCYGNATFSDAEADCYQFLLEALPQGDVGQKPRITFVSTKVDSNHLQAKQGLSNPDSIRVILTERFKLLKQRDLKWSELPEKYDPDNTISFMASNARDFAMQGNKDPNSLIDLLFTDFMRKFMTWCVQLQKVRYHAVFTTISNACGNFYHTMHSSRANRLENIDRDMKLALLALHSFKESINTAMMDLLNQLPAKVQARVNDQALLKQICDRAANCQLILNGATRFGNEREAIGQLKAAIGGAVSELYLQPVLDEFDASLNTSVASGVQKLLDDMKDNDTLKSGLKNVLTIDEVGTEFFVVAGSYGSFVSKVIDALKGKGFVSAILFGITSPVLLAMFLGTAVIAILDSVLSIFQTIDANWRRKAITHIVENLPKTITPDILGEGAGRAFAELTDAVEEEMAQSVLLAQESAAKFAKAEKVLPSLRYKFAELETLCTFAIAQLGGYTEPPVYQMGSDGKRVVLGEGATGVVERGRWYGHEVVLKRPVVLQDYVLLSFFEEVHYSLELTTKSSSAHLLRIIGVWRDPKEGWSMMYPLCNGSLRNYLIDNRSKLTLKQCLDLCVQATRGVAAMHAVGVMHRDIKLDNTMYTIDPSTGRINLYIADFGTCTNSSAPTTIVGTKGYIAPEVENASPVQSYDWSADCYSLTIMITTIVPDILSRANTELEQGGPKEWTTVVMALSDKPEYRPSLADFLRALEVLYATAK